MLIEFYSSSEFENLLCLNNMEKLENCFQSAKHSLQKNGIECDRGSFSDCYPGYIVDDTIYLKMPTFSIRILDNKYDEKDIVFMFKAFDSVIIARETNVMIDKSVTSCISVWCGKDTLKLNTDFANEIEGFLKHEKIDTERCISFLYYKISLKKGESI